VPLRAALLLAGLQRHRSRMEPLAAARPEPLLQLTAVAMQRLPARLGPQRARLLAELRQAALVLRRLHRLQLACQRSRIRLNPVRSDRK
jgi:hypothetical protein